ncbi:MAG: ABC transporter substrate-binding protein [Candidatus Diapherotrites archaeon]|uniref:ABC transporter substrate-binding protein n=1 Tax=Candidatus Iainarchaeum sp. TaxID=3101447 RepID=A0A8T4LFD6_9ARCH|nr:ABC transporter substrate-binding protein [Candidatus Diapherotrites archaeon]
MKTGFLLLVLTVAIVAFSGCVQNNEPDSQEKLNIAVLIPQTGPAASLGQDFFRGMELAQKDLNNSDLALHIEDTKTDPKEAVTALNNLIDSNQAGVILTIQALHVSPILPIAEQHSIPVFAALTSLDPSEYTRKSEYAFLMYPLPSDQISKIVNFLDKKQYQKVALLIIQDEFGQAMQKKFKDEFRGEILIQENYQLSQTDFRTTLSKIKATNPDAIFFLGYPPHALNFLKQRSELGMENIPVVSTEDIQSNFVQENAKGLLGEVYSLVPSALVESGKAEQFRAAFKSQYGSEPDFVAHYGYDLMLVLDALVKKQITKGTVQELKINGVAGPIVFNQYGEAQIELVFVTAGYRTPVNFP